MLQILLNPKNEEVINKLLLTWLLLSIYMYDWVAFVYVISAIIISEITLIVMDYFSNMYKLYMLYAQLDKDKMV